MANPLQRLNHRDKCLWYFHPSYVSDKWEIAAESQTISSYLYCMYLSILPHKLQALKFNNVN